MVSTTALPMRGRATRSLIALMFLVGTIFLAAAPVAAADPGPGSAKGIAARTVDVQLLSINDLHGNIEPPSGSSARVLTEAGAVENNGGVEYLATHVRQL